MDEQTLKALGIRIRDLRTAAGMSQETLCGECGVDRAYLSQIEGGTRNPSVSVVARIADALGVEVSELLNSGSTQGTARGDSAIKEFMAEAARDAEDDLNATIKRLRERGFTVTVDGHGTVRVKPPL